MNGRVVASIAGGTISVAVALLVLVFVDSSLPGP